jgi:multifunctional methyltransferase subunit TRM112
MLVCNVKGCGKDNFPLQIKGEPVKEESEFNPEFIKHMIPKLDWNALVLACKDVRRAVELFKTFVLK